MNFDNIAFNIGLTLAIIFIMISIRKKDLDMFLDIAEGFIKKVFRLMVGRKEINILTVSDQRQWNTLPKCGATGVISKDFVITNDDPSEIRSLGDVIKSYPDPFNFSERSKKYWEEKE